jgi:hypothetical protein
MQENDTPLDASFINLENNPVINKKRKRDQD